MSGPILSFAAFVRHDADLQTLRSFAAARGLTTDALQRGTVVDACAYLQQSPSPKLLLVEIPSREEAPALLEQLAEHCDPSTQVIVVGQVNEYSFYCWLQDIGIDHYLLLPLTSEMLAQACDKLEVGNPSAVKSSARGKVIAVLGARGGVGASTVALNMAGVIGEQTRRKVALVDLDAQEGSIALMLDMQPLPGLREVLEKPNSVDPVFLDRVMGKAGKYLSVLSAEEKLSESLLLQEQALTGLLEELRSHYAYVVLDVPRHMTLCTRACLQQADHSVLVMDLSLLCLRDVLRMQDAMRDAWNVKPPLLVANRLGLAPKQHVPQAEFTKATGAECAAQIPFAPEIYMPLSREIPALTHPSHAAVKPLAALVASLLSDQKNIDPGAQPATGWRSLFQKHHA